MDPRGLAPSVDAQQQQQMLQQQALHSQALHRQAMQRAGLHQAGVQPGSQQQSQCLAAGLFRAAGMQQAAMTHVNGSGSSSLDQLPVRATREGGIADLNAEPPASDGEGDGPAPSDSTPSAATVTQPESSRSVFRHSVR